MSASVHLALPFVLPSLEHLLTIDDRLRSTPFLRYSNGTFTLTTQFGASASVTFNGTDVWIFGAKRGNHAPYNTTLDGSQSNDNGYSSVDRFQQVLFHQPNLTSGSHTVSIADSVQDSGKPYLDIDWVRLGLASFVSFW